MTTQQPESLAAAIVRKEKEIIRLGGKWRIPKTNRSLGRENAQAQAELDRLAFEFGEAGKTFAHGRPATPALRVPTKDELWAQYRLLDAVSKNAFWKLHRVILDS